MSDPAVLETEVAPEPSPAAGEILVRVKAVGLNPIDYKIAAGNLRALAPLPIFPGVDCAGVVEQAGSSSGFKAGDKVIANGFGFLAELAVASGERVALKPESWTFEQAAALPTPGLTAQAVLAASPDLAGKDVVIVGASGGVGSLATQLARRAGAKRVYAVCSGRNAEFVRRLGADEVLDHTLGDWTQRFRGAEAPAYVWDLSPVGGRSVWEDVASWLPPTSTLVSINLLDPSFTLSPGATFDQVSFTAVNRGLNAIGRAPAYKFVDATQVPSARKGLEALGAAAERGDLTAPSVEAFAFEDVHRAVAKLMAGHVQGKVVVTL